MAYYTVATILVGLCTNNIIISALKIGVMHGGFKNRGYAWVNRHYTMLVFFHLQDMINILHL
jgi:hypothetical protein